MLVESIDPLPSSEEEERTCRLPTFVDDKRYPPQLLKHVYILHNHPSPITLSDRDVRAIATAARIHGKFVETRDGRIPVSIIAFFSNSYNPSQPTCDGFFEYSIATTDLWKWTPDEKGKWQREKMGTITWSDGQVYRFQSR
jgi:hypothetical protein